MFTVDHPSPDLLHIEISGKITAEEMATGLDTLLPLTQSKEVSKIRALYHDIALPEAGALFEEIKRLPQLFHVIGKVKKVAVISDQKWIRDMAELEGMVLPGTTVRGFTPSERAGADAYLDVDHDTDDENFPV